MPREVVLADPRRVEPQLVRKLYLLEGLPDRLRLGLALVPLDNVERPELQ